MDLLIDATSMQSKRYAGIGQYTENIIANMTQNPPEDTGYILYDSVQYSKEAVNPMKERGRLNLYKIPNIFMKSPFVQSYALSRMTNSMRKKKKELVYFCPYFVSGFPTSGIPMVITMHDVALLKFNYYSDRGGVYNMVRKFEYNNWLPKTALANKIITNSHFTKDEFLKFMPTYPRENVIPIYLGIELQETESKGFDKSLPKEWRDVGYILYLGGGIQKNKNSEGVINAYKLFVDRLLNEGVERAKIPYLVIAGKIFLNSDSQQTKNLHNLIAQFELRDKIVFTGFYEDKEKYSLLKNAIMFIHLSLYEGFGIAVGEAMRAGTAVIADKSSSYPEVLGDTGLLVDGTNPEECADAIYRLNRDRGMAVALGAAARERSFKFSWQETAEQTYQVLQEVYVQNYGSLD